MFFREQKSPRTAPIKIFGRRFFSVLEGIESRIASLLRAPTPPIYISLSQDFRKQDCSPELHSLIDKLQAFRKKILANSVSAACAAWISWILLALIAVFSISSKLAISTAIAGTLAALGAGAILWWTWRTRLSTYQTACRIDAAAGLQDRVSTAIFLGNSKHPSGMIEPQREDALARIAKVDLRRLDPLRMPAATRRAVILFLVVGALFLYRLHHQPPLSAFLRMAARSQLVQAIVSPLLNTLEKDVQRTMALVTAKPDALAEEVRASESAASNQDLWQSNGDNSADTKQDQQDSLGTGESPKDQQQTPGEQNGSPSEQSRPQESSAQQSQNGKNAGDNSAGDSAKPSDSQGSQSQQESLGQSLMQS